MRCDKCPLCPSDDVCDIAYSEYGIEHKDGMSGCRHSWNWCKKQADEYAKSLRFIGVGHIENCGQKLRQGNMVELTPKVVLKTKQGYEVYSDSYMLTMSKKDLIKIIRCLEHNWANEILVAERQYNLLMKNKDNINFDV